MYLLFLKAQKGNIEFIYRGDTVVILEENGTCYVQILNCNTVEKEITVTKDEMVTVLEAEFETKRVKYNEMINLSKKLKKPCF